MQEFFLFTTVVSQLGEITSF